MTNMTGFTNATSLAKLAQATSVATGGLVGLLIMITVFVVIFISLLRSNAPQESMMAASLVTTLVGFMLLAANLVDKVYFVGVVVIMAVVSIALYLNK